MWARIKKWFAGPIIYNADNPEAFDPFLDLVYRYGQLQAENADLRAVVRSLQHECTELRRDLKMSSNQLVARPRSTLNVFEEDDCA